MRAFAAMVAALLAFAGPADAAPQRSRDVAAQFQRLHPCPSTGKRSGSCPGYVKDHVNPLCAGGPDTVSNMQWQTVPAAKAKDRWERQICRKRKA